MIRIGALLLIVAAAALQLHAGVTPTQAIYTGSLKIDGGVPAGGARIEVLNEQMQWIRDTHYDTTSGAYGVSLYGSDGLVDGSPLHFRVTWDGGMFIAHTSGASPVYHGTPLDPPIPPEPIIIYLTNNHPPQITSTPPDTAREDSTFHYVITGTDPDLDPITFGYVSGPAWLHMDTSSATLSGVPARGDVGDVQVTVNADDHNYLGVVTQTFTLHVLHTNHLPVFRSKAPAVAYVDSPYHYQALAVDADDDHLEYQLLSGPRWLHADTSNGSYSGTPTADDVGDTVFTILVSDGNGGSDEQTSHITVRFGNRPPAEFVRVEPKDSATVRFPGGLALRWHHAIDPDGDDVAYVVNIILPDFGIDTTFTVPDTGLVVPDLPLPPHPHVVVLVHWSVTATDGHLFTSAANGPGVFKLDIAAGVGDDGAIPKEYALGQNYPNPFNPTTMVTFGLPQSSDVTVTIFNTLGLQIKTLVAGRSDAGVHSVEWNGRNDIGTPVASGVYLCRINAIGADGTVFTAIRKMLLAK